MAVGLGYRRVSYTLEPFRVSCQFPCAADRYRSKPPSDFVRCNKRPKISRYNPTKLRYRTTIEHAARDDILISVNGTNENFYRQDEGLQS